MSLRFNVTPSQRRSKLINSIDAKGFVRIIEAHNGLSALVGQTASFERDGQSITYDGFWESSLTDSASKGLPDAEIVGNPSRLHTIDEILSVTSKPMIVDGDTGGSDVQFEYFVRDLERLGVSAVIIEDKIFPKRNSLDASAMQTLENPDVFSRKIVRGREARVTDVFMVIARLESLIAGLGMDDAVMRANKYIESGVDGIMIHSKNDNPDEVIAFAKLYDKLCKPFGRRPILVCVPTTYNLITDAELAQYGFDVIIHANHLLRASHKAMLATSEVILSSDRGFEAEPWCIALSKVFAQVGFDHVKSKDREASKAQRLSVIIPAAGQDPVFTEGPKSLIEINSKPILRHQIETIRKVGINQIIVVRGYKGEEFDKLPEESGLIYCDNPQYLNTHSIHSLFCADQYLGNGFVLAFSDILFSDDILRWLIDTENDIVLAVDNSYRYHRHEIDKNLDLVVTSEGRTGHHRSLHPVKKKVEITQMGKNVSVEKADYEFTGLAYFSEEGARIAHQVYRDCLENVHGTFHEADSFAQATISDFLQEIINRGFSVYGLEVYKGWMEVHNQADIETAGKELRSDLFGS
jgi:phosphoenolpyruvate phosphomutase